MAILTIGRLGFGRREKFVAQKFFRWFAWYFVFNFILCLAVLYFAEPALTGPFGGWQSAVLRICSPLRDRLCRRWRKLPPRARGGRGAIVLIFQFLRKPRVGSSRQASSV